MFRFHSFLLRYKALAFAAILLFLCAVTFLASKITLEEDITGLVPSGERQNIIRKVLDQTEFADKIIVTISSTSSKADPEEVTQYAQQFLDSVNLYLPEYVSDIQGKVQEEGIREIYTFIYNNLPLFLNEEDYQIIESRLPRDSISRRLEENYKNLISPTGLVTKEFLFKDPLSITSLGLNKLEELQVGDDFELYNNFLITRDHQHVLLFLSPVLPSSETQRNLVFVERLEKIQQHLNSEFTNVKGEFFGGVLYAVANAQQIKQDIQITMSIAAGILLLILIFYYQRIYVPLVLFIPSILGGLTAIAVLFLLKGAVSAISLGIGAILLGISIDYSLHILTHYKNNKDLNKLYREVTGPVLMSSSTTAIAFLCLLFVRSEALNDLGIFAAVSVLVASFFALVLIPLLYKAPPITESKSNVLDKIAAVSFQKNNPLVILVVLLFISSLFFFTQVKFNNDLSDLNYEPLDIKQRENNVKDIAGRTAKSIYLVSYGNSIDEALEYNNRLYRQLRRIDTLGLINNFSSIGGVVLSTATQIQRIEQWKEFWTPEKREQLKQNSIEESSRFSFRPESFQKFYELISTDFDPIYLEDYKNTTTLYLEDFISVGDNFATVTTSLNVPSENYGAVLEEFKNKENVVVVDRQQINEDFLGNLKEDFNRLIGYSVLAVFILLLVFYRSLELSLLTLLPIGVTWVITLGIMAVFNIEFNILNIIISTFIFGLGLDYSIFMTNAFLTQYETGSNVVKTYRTSILLSVLTTLLGIGALFFAKHPALQSISIISIIGVITAVFVAFVFQSYIFQSLFLDRKKEGRPPFSIKNIVVTSSFKRVRDRLYLKRKTLDNYRYKKVYPEVKKEFEDQRERFLKIADFISENDRILHLYSGWGLLPLFLNSKKQVLVTGIEPDPAKLLVANNTFSSSKAEISFYRELPLHFSTYNVLILSGEPGSQEEMNNLITREVKKVIILEPEYPYRWLTDLNFQIEYRQNKIVFLKKMD